MSPNERLQLLRPFADDRHFGVREWAWIGLRDSLVENMLELHASLATWSHSAAPNVRRFASEITRPRGVWCRYLRYLRRDPAKAGAILEPLRSDESRYVRLSVGNWLNDAGKDNPEWVHSICSRWLEESPTQHTQWICARGTRSMR